MTQSNEPTPQLPANPSEPTIDHPIQNGWLLRALRPMDEAHRESIASRLAGTGIDVESTIQAVDEASLRTDMHRMTHETDNVGRLKLSTSEVEHYGQLAGNPEKVGEYVHWFGRAALGAFRRTDHAFDFDAISLELGGRRQEGDWESTHPLDEMVRSIPGQLEAYGDVAIEVLLRRSDMRNYMLMPLLAQGSDWTSFDYAMVRRRRGVANITIDEQRMYIFKQSIGLLIPQLMPGDKGKKLLEAFRRLGPVQGSDPETFYNFDKYTEPAIIAGRALENAIASRDRSAIRDVIPVSAQYVMKMARPAVAAAIGAES